jgi:hypothetical protein
MAILRAISGVGGKGPACFLIEADGARLLLDLGLGPQPGRLPDVSQLGKIDALLLSHGHRDHAGGMHLRDSIGNPPVYAPAPVAQRLPPELAARPLPLGDTTEVLGIRVRTGRNGHSPGGAWLHLDVGGGLIYMGDHSVESLIYAFDMPPLAATLVLDASYGRSDKTLADCIAQLAPVFARGNALFPIPIAGRGPEMVFHVTRTQSTLPYIGDDLRAALARMVDENAASLHAHVIAEMSRIARDAPPIDGPRGLMFTGYADATEGEAARLVAQWESQTAPEIVFTGYLPDGTPAARLVASGRAQYLGWNVHPRLADNATLVRAVGAKTVLPAFCEREHLPALAAAFAPAHTTMDTPVTL